MARSKREHCGKPRGQQDPSEESFALIYCVIAVPQRLPLRPCCHTWMRPPPLPLPWAPLPGEAAPAWRSGIARRKRGSYGRARRHTGHTVRTFSSTSESLSKRLQQEQGEKPSRITARAENSGSRPPPGLPLGVKNPLGSPPWVASWSRSSGDPNHVYQAPSHPPFPGRYRCENGCDGALSLAWEKPPSQQLVPGLFLAPLSCCKPSKKSSSLGGHWSHIKVAVGFVPAVSVTCNFPLP